jgi:[acyl-carrier-protein] S-malonyltransferase
VRWERCVQKLAELGATSAIEVGPGKVLSGLVKRISPAIATHQFADPAGLEALRALQFATGKPGSQEGSL